MHFDPFWVGGASPSIDGTIVFVFDGRPGVAVPPPSLTRARPDSMQDLPDAHTTEDPPSFRSIQPPNEAIVRAVCAADQIEVPAERPAWRFHVLGPETTERVAWLKARRTEEREGSAVARRMFTRWCKVPGWIVITCRRSGDEGTFEEEYARASNAVQNFVLSLWSEHIDTAWLTGEFVDDEQLYEILELTPEKVAIMGILWYGYRSEGRRARRLVSSERVRSLP